METNVSGRLGLSGGQLSVSGTVADNLISLSGQIQSDTLRLAGSVSGTTMQGTISVIDLGQTVTVDFTVTKN